MFLTIHNNKISGWHYYIKFDEIKMICLGDEVTEEHIKSGESFRVYVYLKNKDEVFTVNEEEYFLIMNQLTKYNDWKLRNGPNFNSCKKNDK